ncbi:hypothetical protein DRF65_26375 [Chryseobacterium pennae]|uniref:TraB/GumN family protein n=1 Tax=Chryseobacterium pennae TaxID=2258962 RepID=A0A3D9C1E5_9FLAO|nr:DUF5694 domain-containing protein [Chryseobacterium pennae]REC59352.1 hypothetical protein DRF65_26375 [Chryseobacterium pennae]
MLITLKKVSLLIVLFVFSFSFSQEKINVLLLGTYHFNNPGSDAVKNTERNILTPENQKDLDQITQSIISKFKPDQIFVESNFNKKDDLNNQYQLYLNNQYSKFTDTVKKPRYKRYYIEGETSQLAFRLAKRANINQIYPIDSLIEMRLDILKKEMYSKNETKVLFEKELAKMTQSSNRCMEKKSLRDVFICLNEKEDLAQNKGFYISVANKINSDGKYFGSNLVADWYKRNLIMYANIQNQLEPKTKNIFVLVGTGHAAIFKEFFENDENFNLIEVDDIL